MTLAYPGSVTDWLGHWWLVHVKPGKERRLSKELQESGILQFLLPIQKFISVQIDAKGHRHRQERERILFPGYLFLCGDEEARYTASRSLRTNAVRDVVDQKRFVREIAAVQVAMNAGVELADECRVVKGQPVEITGGPLRGCYGVVDDLKSGIVYLNVTILGGSHSVEIMDPRTIRPVD